MGFTAGLALTHYIKLRPPGPHCGSLAIAAHGVIDTPRYDIIASGSIVSDGGGPVFTTKVLPQPLIENHEHFWTLTASPTTW